MEHSGDILMETGGLGEDMGREKNQRMDQEGDKIWSGKKDK